MYPISVQYLIPYSELLNLFLRWWLDISVIHSFSIDHWKLLIFEPTTSSAFIVDSIKKGKSEGSYLVSKLIPSGFERNFTWTTINCYQQSGSWECDYMLIKHMWEFVETIQHDFINRVSVFHIFKIYPPFNLFVYI
ncbi:putative papain-like cysteine peptidase superfamily [Helianthus anomalus]